MIVPPLSQLSQLENVELGKLSADWRLQPARGIRDAFGIAHTLEKEVRRRQRAVQTKEQHHELDAPPAAPGAPAGQRWWERWRSTGPSPSDPTPLA